MANAYPPIISATANTTVVTVPTRPETSVCACTADPSLIDATTVPASTATPGATGAKTVPTLPMKKVVSTPVADPRFTRRVEQISTGATMDSAYPARISATAPLTATTDPTRLRVLAVLSSIIFLFILH